MKLHIVRDGHELGLLPVRDARELVQSGFLRATDEFWTDDPQSARPLATLLEPRQGPGWLGLATSSITGVGNTVRGQAVVLSKKAAGLFPAARTQAAVTGARALWDFMPRLRGLIAQKLATTMVSSKAALQDEEFLRKLFGAVYDCLPKPVGRFVSEPAFIEFCFKHRRKLLR